MTVWISIFCAFEVLQVCLCMIEGFPSCLVLLMIYLFHPDQGSRAGRSGITKLRLQTQLGLVNNRTPSLAHTYSCPITSGTRLTIKELRKEKRIREFAFDSSLRDCVCYLKQTTSSPENCLRLHRAPSLGPALLSFI